MFSLRRCHLSYRILLPARMRSCRQTRRESSANLQVLFSLFFLPLLPLLSSPSPTALFRTITGRKQSQSTVPPNSGRSVYWSGGGRWWTGTFERYHSKLKTLFLTIINLHGSFVEQSWNPMLRVVSTKKRIIQTNTGII